MKNRGFRQMAFDKHLFIEDLLGANGHVAQLDALDEITNFIDRDFTTDREMELEESYEALCGDFDVLEDAHAKLCLEVQELKKQIAELKGETPRNFDFGVLEKSKNFAYAEM